MEMQSVDVCTVQCTVGTYDEKTTFTLNLKKKMENVYKHMEYNVRSN